MVAEGRASSKALGQGQEGCVCSGSERRGPGGLGGRSEGLQITLHGGMPPPGILQRALAQVSVEQLALAALQAEWERAEPARERRPNDAGEEYRQPGLGVRGGEERRGIQGMRSGAPGHHGRPAPTLRREDGVGCSSLRDLLC